MSSEKCFGVYFSLKSKTVCTVRTAKWATGIIGITLAGYHALYIFVLGSCINKSSGHPDCYYMSDYMIYLRTVDSVPYSFGPFILMFITNFAIAFKFMRSKCKSNQNNSTESTNQALGKSATRGTAMVVTVSVTFLVLTAPSAVNNALYSKYPLNNDLPLYRAFCNLTLYLNHFVNGVLYCAVGSRFRIELFQLFCQKVRT